MRRPKRSGSPARKPSEVQLRPQAAAAVRRGHPWVWRQGIERGGQGLEAGAVVQLREAGGALVGSGLWDPASPIAVRVFGLGEERPSVEKVVERIERAIARRDAFVDGSRTNTYRLCHGEGDRVPGLVLDRYDHVVVAKLDGAHFTSWFDEVAEKLWPRLRERGIRSFVRRIHRDEDRSQGKIERVFGDEPPARITVLENGIRMVVDVAEGQKTGAFLDQRDNRDRVRRLAKGRRVLNLFSYAGGFSTAAALGGASHVTSVDIAHAAHKTAQASMRENGLDPAAHAFVTADAFAFLDNAKRRGESWDLIISDPPSFAPSEKALTRALGAYRKLHAACAAVLAEGGIFCASSCSSHVSPEIFLTTLDDGSLGRADLSVLEVHGAGADHPIVAGFPEGRYLKFVVLA